jgi:proteic killer suppression protein
MIRSFSDKETERIWDGAVSRRLPREMQDTARRKLRLINNAHASEDLRIPPGNRLEAMKGDLAGLMSIRINDQWRIVFRWSEGDAHDVRISDYH